MLACIACLKRYSRLAIGTGLLLVAPHTLSSTLPLSRFQRPISSARGNVARQNDPFTRKCRGYDRYEDRKLAPRGFARQEFQNKVAASGTNRIVSKEQFVTKLRETSTTETSTAETDNVAEERRRKNLEWAVHQHLKYLGDRWKIAKHVEATLAKGRFDEALLLTQRASSMDNCVVAWNHLFDYSLNVDKRLKATVKLFNDMKKRGQRPNDRTYTVIFRGCANVPDQQAAVKYAVQLYHTLLKDKRVQPNTIHLNAVLQVCGSAGDIDSLFSIAETADAKPGLKADARTYTIIINSLRTKLLSELNPETPGKRPSEDAQRDDAQMEDAQMEDAQREAAQREDAQIETQQVIEQCKAIWDEVMREWRNGKLILDEHLVCVMGRTLLLQGHQGTSEVFTLLEDTMSIPFCDTDGSIKEYMDPTMKNIAISVHTTPKKVPDSKKGITYAVPGQNTLSLILDVARKHGRGKQNKISSAYWRLFTEHYGLQPDEKNYNQYMQHRERSKASASAKNLLTDMPANYITPPLVHRALQACLRDNMNPNVFQNATDILHKVMQGMESTRAENGQGQRIDLLALLLYHRVAHAADYSFRQMAKNDEEEAARRGYGMQLATAIEELWAPFLMAQAVLNAMYKSVSKNKPSTADRVERREAFEENLLDLARDMVATVNKIENNDMLPHQAKLLKDIKNKRNAINHFVVQLTDPQQRVS